VSQRRVVLRYVLVVFLCLLGLYLVGISGMGFFPPHGERDWQSIIMGIVVLSLGIGVWIGTYILNRKLRQM
jgi:drug/metabolite transporter (DMT)-like permease